MTQLATQHASAQMVQPSAMDLLHMAVTQGAPIDTVERLVKLQQQMMERDAEREFNLALHATQEEVKRVGFDKKSDKGGYVSFTKLDAVLRPHYSKQGFALSFDTADGRTVDSMKVIAYLSHIGGHTRTYTIDVPCDGKGAKGNDVMTRTHATGSGMSYGKRYLEASIFNVTVGDTDDDGKAAGGGVTDSQMADYLSAIEAATTTEELRNVWEKANAFAEGMKDVKARKALGQAAKARKEVLLGQPY